MCTPQELQQFGPMMGQQTGLMGSMQGGLNRGPAGTPTTGAASPLGGPQGSGQTGPSASGFPSEGAANLALTGPEPGTPGLIPPQRIGKYGKGGGRPGREMRTGAEYRPQQVFAQDNGPGPLSGGMIGDYMKRLKA